jgi:hypothetical protein
MTLGAQKGARITRAVWDEATESAPWMGRVAARWSPDGYLMGVVLTPDQMHQMVHLGHEKVGVLRDHVQRVAEEYQDDLSAKKEQGSKGGGKKSLVPPVEAATITQHSPSTGKYRYSTDGGKTWQPGQPPNQ